MIATVLALTVLTIPHRIVVPSANGPIVSVTADVSADATGFCIDTLSVPNNSTCFATSYACTAFMGGFHCTGGLQVRNPASPIRQRFSVRATRSPGPESPRVPEVNVSCDNLHGSGCPCDVLYTPSGACVYP